MLSIHGELTIAVLPVGPLGANCTVACHKGSGEAVVCDAGGHVPKILRALKSTGAATCTTAFFTHGHYDHILGAADLKAATAAPIVIHRLDSGMFSKAAKQHLEEDDGQDDVSSGAAAGDARWPTVDRFVAEGDEIRVGPVVGKIIETPGHTRGSCSLWFESCKLLIAGDTVFRGSFGRTDLPGGSEEQIKVSLRKLFALPPDTVIITGHGETTTVDYEREHNMAKTAGWL